MSEEEVTKRFVENAITGEREFQRKLVDSKIKDATNIRLRCSAVYYKPNGTRTACWKCFDVPVTKVIEYDLKSKKVFCEEHRGSQSHNDNRYECQIPAEVEFLTNAFEDEKKRNKLPWNENPVFWQLFASVTIGVFCLLLGVFIHMIL